MPTPAEHYARAEQVLAEIDRLTSAPTSDQQTSALLIAIPNMFALAQVHATLAAAVWAAPREEDS